MAFLQDIFGMTVVLESIDEINYSGVADQMKPLQQVISRGSINFILKRTTT